MLTNEIDGEVIPSLSKERFSSYEKLFKQIVPSHATSSSYRRVLFYLKIQELYACFYLPMQILEVSLRNRIHVNKSSYYRTREWLDELKKEAYCTPYIKQSINATIQKTLKEFSNKKRAIEPEDYITRITFGFWVTMLDNHFRPSLFWQIHIDQVFPNRSGKSLGYIHNELLRVGTLRNRLYHYEPIWKNLKVFANIEEFCNYLLEEYDRILELTYFCSSSQRKLIENHREKFFQEILKFKLNFRI